MNCATGPLSLPRTRSQTRANHCENDEKTEQYKDQYHSSDPHCSGTTDWKQPYRQKFNRDDKQENAGGDQKEGSVDLAFLRNTTNRSWSVRNKDHDDQVRQNAP